MLVHYTTIIIVQYLKETHAVSARTWQQYLALCVCFVTLSFPTDGLVKPFILRAYSQPLENKGRNNPSILLLHTHTLLVPIALGWTETSRVLHFRLSTEKIIWIHEIPPLRSSGGRRYDLWNSRGWNLKHFESAFRLASN